MSWCGKGDKPRSFQYNPPTICYEKPKAATISKIDYDKKRHETILGKLIEKFIVEKKSAKAWKLLEGDLCRISLTSGSQVNILL